MKEKPSSDKDKKDKQVQDLFNAKVLEIQAGIINDLSWQVFALETERPVEAEQVKRELEETNKLFFDDDPVDEEEGIIYNYKNAQKGKKKK